MGEGKDYVPKALSPKPRPLPPFFDYVGVPRKLPFAGSHALASHGTDNERNGRLHEHGSVPNLPIAPTRPKTEQCGREKPGTAAELLPTKENTHTQN